MDALDEKRERIRQSNDKGIEEMRCERCGLTTSQDNGDVITVIGSSNDDEYKRVFYRYLCGKCTKDMLDKMERLHKDRCTETGNRMNMHAWEDRCWCCGSLNYSNDYIDLWFEPGKIGAPEMGWFHKDYKNLCKTCGEALYKIVVEIEWVSRCDRCEAEASVVMETTIQKKGTVGFRVNHLCENCYNDLTEMEIKVIGKTQTKEETAERIARMLGDNTALEAMKAFLRGISPTDKEDRDVN